MQVIFLIQVNILQTDQYSAGKSDKRRLYKKDQPFFPVENKHFLRPVEPDKTVYQKKITNKNPTDDPV